MGTVTTTPGTGAEHAARREVMLARLAELDAIKLVVGPAPAVLVTAGDQVQAGDTPPTATGEGTVRP